MSNKEPEFTFCKNCERPGICGSKNKCLKPCVICGGTGTVNGRDHFDPLWDYERYNNPYATCTSCGGSGLAKDMTWC